MGNFTTINCPTSPSLTTHHLRNIHQTITNHEIHHIPPRYNSYTRPRSPATRRWRSNDNILRGRQGVRLFSERNGSEFVLSRAAEAFHFLDQHTKYDARAGTAYGGWGY